MATISSGASGATAAAGAPLPSEPNWLRDPLDSTRDIAIHLIGEGGMFNQSDHEQQAQFNVLGAKYSVVIADTPIKGEHFEFHFEFMNDTEWAAFNLIRSGQRTLLYQRFWTNEQFYIRFNEVGELSIYNYTPTYRTFHIGAEEQPVP